MNFVLSFFKNGKERKPENDSLLTQKVKMTKDVIINQKETRYPLVYLAKTGPYKLQLICEPLRSRATRMFCFQSKNENPEELQTKLNHS